MNKASEGDGIPAELLQILKQYAAKVLHSLCQQIWKTQQWSQNWKRSVFIPIPMKGNAKACTDYCTFFLISHARKVMLKIVQARLQKYVQQELPDVQAGFSKGRRTRDQIVNIHWITEKAREFQKKSTSASLTMLKPWTVWITTNWKILKEMGISDHMTYIMKTCLHVKKQQLESDMEQRTGSKLGKEYVKAVYCHPAYLTYMQGTSCKMLGWMRHKLELRLPGEISITSDMQMIPPLWQKAKRN